jgi:NifU-like protein
VRSLPRVVFEHFRRPQNLGALDPADAVGQIEGRREESWIRLALRRNGEALEASFELRGDRSGVAGLSLLTSWIHGRTLAEVAHVTLEEVAAHYALEDEFLPLLLPAMEVLASALAQLGGQADPYASDGEVVCTCLHVRRGRLERVIRERSLKTVADVRHWTHACTGCRSCRDDVEEMLGL